MFFDTYIADTPVRAHFSILNDELHIDRITVREPYEREIYRTRELVKALAALILEGARADH